MTIKPLFNQLLIKPIEQKTLILAEKKTLCEYGEVLAVGGGVGEHPFWLFKLLGIRKKDAIKVGDKVGFVLWGLNALDIDGTKHYFVQENPDFLLGVIKDEGLE